MEIIELNNEAIPDDYLRMKSIDIIKAVVVYLKMMTFQGPGNSTEARVQTWDTVNNPCIEIQDQGFPNLFNCL